MGGEIMSWLMLPVDIVLLGVIVCATVVLLMFFMDWGDMGRK